MCYRSTDTGKTVYQRGYNLFEMNIKCILTLPMIYGWPFGHPEKMYKIIQYEIEDFEQIAVCEKLTQDHKHHIYYACIECPKANTDPMSDIFVIE